MDFKSLLDTYSENIDSTERSNIFAQSTPIDNSEAIQDFIESYDSNASHILADENIDDNQTENTPTNEPIEISDDVLSALSELDSPMEETPEEVTPETPVENFENTFDDINAEIDNLTDELTNDNDVADDDDDIVDELNLEDFVDDTITDEVTDDIDNDIVDDEVIDELNLDDIVENNEVVDNDVADELNLEDFVDDTITDEVTDDIDNDIVDDEVIDELNLDDIVENNEVVDNDIDTDEVVDDINLDDEVIDELNLDDIVENNEVVDDNLGFDIELPEEFKEETPEEDEVVQEEQEVPDFTGTEMSEQDVQTPIVDESIPAEFEQVDKSINFDAWKDKDSSNTLMELTEEQSFKIRYKINSLSDQNIRFRIREILADAQSHQDVYPGLMSLLLVDAPESSFVSFFEKLEDSHGIDVFPSSDIPEYTSTFLAKDVVDYQDTIYRIKTEFIFNLKKYALYGIIALLSGTIAWLGFAQPMRINSIFEKGLVAIQLDNYIEGEALFQQANNIAGKPVAEWYMKYADVYKDKNLVTEAGSKYLSALVIEPKNITIAMHASDFYTNLGPKYYSNAMNIMENLSTYYPKDFSVWDYWGSLFIHYSDFFIDNIDEQTTLLYRAVDIYQKYLINNSNNPAPFYRILDIYIKIGNSEQIDKIANFLEDLDPKNINIEIMTHLGKYYTDRRNLTGADKVFRQLTPILDKYHEDIEPLQSYMDRLYNIPPENISNVLSESYYEFARYKMLSSDFKVAGTLLTNSLMFNDNNADSYNLLGEAYLRSREPTNVKLRKAKEFFDQALALNPNSYKAHMNLGHLYYTWDNEFGDLDVARNSALYHYRYATSLMPPNVKSSLLSYNHGWLEFYNNNAEKAIDIWSDIYKNNPESSVISYALGSALYQVDNPQLAQIVLEKSANNLEAIKDGIAYPDVSNRRHREVFTQLAKTYNNIGVINANYGLANSGRREDFEAKALMNFYKAQDLSDQLGRTYSTTEYNIGVLTRPNISNRRTVFDEEIPKQTSLENPVNQFNHLLLENI